METEHLDKNQKVKLKKYLTEAQAALTIKDAASDTFKNVAEVAHEELKVDKKIFKKTAMLMHKNKFLDEEGTLDACKDLYEQTLTVTDKVIDKDVLADEMIEDMKP